MLAVMLGKRPPVALRFGLVPQALLAPLHLPSAPLHQDAPQDEYSAAPQYPPILDTSPVSKRRRKQEEWHQKVTKLPTVEQKMMELNMPRFYGHWSCHLQDDRPTLLGTPFAQFATRTHLQRELPEGYYGEVWQEAEAAADRVAGQVEQLIGLNYNTQLSRRIRATPAAQQRRKTQNFLYGLHRVLSGALQDTPHVTHASVDLKPRIEAYWILGSLPPDNLLKKTRRGLPWTKLMEDDPMERPIQGYSTPTLGLRVCEGLPEVVGRGEGLAAAGEVPGNDLDPRSFMFKFKHRHATTVTGSWPSEGKQYGHLFLHTLDHEGRHADFYGSHNLPDALVHKAVVACFTQAHAHASYLGFGPVTELTYPLVQQSAFTDGRRWNTAIYQLNTCALHSEKPVDNPHNNILWLSEEEELFEGVNGDGVKGLNTSLLTSLLAMYLKKGIPNPDPTPYLALKHVANHPAPFEYREDFHKAYLRLSSNRPKHRLKPELYLWEKIYKVDFKTRPYDAPRRFFEPHYAQKDPGQERLDEHHTPYIPKSLRLESEKKVRYKPRINTEHLYKYD